MALERQGQFTVAEQEIRKYLEVSSHDPDALMKLGVTYADAGDSVRAQQMIAAMRKPSAGKYVPFYYTPISMLRWATKNRRFNGSIERSISTRIHVSCSPPTRRSRIFAPIPDSRKRHGRLACLNRQISSSNCSQTEESAALERFRKPGS
jgi:hypothetical protein